MKSHKTCSWEVLQVFILLVFENMVAHFTFNKIQRDEIKGVFCFYVLDINVMVYIQATQDDDSIDPRKYIF